MENEIKLIVEMIAKLGVVGKTAFITYLVYALLIKILMFGTVIYVGRLIIIKIYDGIISTAITSDICRILNWKNYDGENCISEKRKQRLLNLIQDNSKEIKYD